MTLLQAHHGIAYEMAATPLTRRSRSDLQPLPRLGVDPGAGAG